MKLLITIALSLFYITFTFSQHLKIDKDALSVLKSEEQVSVFFTFQDCTFGGKYLSEKEFIKSHYKKIIKRNQDTTDWYNAYQNSKKSLWPKAYLKNLNTYLSRYDAPEFVLDSLHRNNYILKVNVVWIYTGYDVGVARSPSKISLMLKIIENNTGKVISTIKVSETRGGNSDEDNDSNWTYLRRVENAFFNSGFKLAIALKRIFK